MRFAFITALLFCSAAHAALPDYVVKLDMGDSGGSAVLIGGGYALTAEHCEVGSDAWISQPGSAWNAMNMTRNGIDEARLIQVAVGPDQPSCTIGPAPSVGDIVTGVGYPSGKPWSHTGRVISIDDNYIYCDFLASPGASGGGLFNKDGELIGICSARDEVNKQSLWIHTNSLVAAVSHVQERYQRTQRIVALCATQCGHCERLKADVAAGKFPGFDFEFATFDHSIGAWDKPQLHAEFIAECNVKSKALPAPIIWIPGTGKYREGYDTAPGLCGFIESVVKFIARGPPTKVPMGAPGASAVAKERELTLIGELAGLKQQLEAMKTDYDHFKEAGVIGKIRGMAALKEDKAEIEESISRIKTKVEDVKEDPSSAIVKLLIGIVTGIAHGFIPFSKQEVLS